MNIITRGGLNTKFSPKDSLDAFLLAQKNSNICGLEVNLRMTNDGYIVIYQDDRISNKLITDLKYNDLLKYNLNTSKKVKKNTIISLHKLLEIYKDTSMIVVLNLNDHGSNNPLYIEKIISIINLYSDIKILVKSHCKDILLKLKEINPNVMIGAVMIDNDSYLWNMNLDFYSISVQNYPLNEFDSIRNYRSGFYLFSDIKDLNTYNKLCDIMGEIFLNTCYLISSNYQLLRKKAD